MAPLLSLVLLLLLAVSCLAEVTHGDDRSDELIRLHRQLVETVSITRSADKVETQNADTDERKVVALIEAWFKLTAEATGIEIHVERHEVTPGGRDNLYVYAGSQRHSHVMLTSHVDTVAPFVGYRADGDRIYGRGTNDAKGCVAAMMLTFRDLLVAGQAQKSGGDLALLFVVGEEIGGEGMKAFDDEQRKLREQDEQRRGRTQTRREELSWDAVIFGEPTDSKLAVSQVGGLVFRLDAHGIATHSGMPERGVDAVALLRRAMDALELVLKDLPSTSLGKHSLTIGQIGGGQADNTVPAHAFASGSYRLFVHPREAIGKIPQAIWKSACPDETFGGDETPCRGITVSFPLEEPPLKLDHDVDGFQTFPARFGSDIGLLSGAHKKYLFGPGSILSAHQEDEFISRAELIASLDAYKKIALACLQNARREGKGDRDRDRDRDGLALRAFPHQK